MKLTSPHLTSRSSVLGFCLSLACLLILSTPGAAQQTPDPAVRAHFVFHIYVDPLYGDDELAGNQVPIMYVNSQAYSVPVFNPQPNMREPLSVHPATVGNAPWLHLQHAPYSFRTLGAAQRWWRGFGLLPYTPVGGGATVERVIYHCLPGLYGPIGVLPAIDEKSGLPFNGETFPLDLQDRECIQGTSALDTIFDARLTGTIVFYIRGIQASTPEHYSKSFIDSVTIRGAREKQTGHPSGSGIAIGGGTSDRLIVSNCFITDNNVGIAIDGSDPSQQNPSEHSPIIVNNTIAWNQIGIWGGRIRGHDRIYGLVPAAHLEQHHRFSGHAGTMEWCDFGLRGDSLGRSYCALSRVYPGQHRLQRLR